METIFSVTTSRNVSDNSVVTCTTAVDPTTSQAPLIRTAVDFSHSNTLVGNVVIHSDHVNPSLAHLSLVNDSLSSTASNDHLMHFTDELSLPMKPNMVGSPLVDDEDDDVRSLLAAAAAVAAAASPSSPQLRSSSSGLNTPPHTRVCSSLDTVVSDEVKDGLDNHEHGLHTPGGAALLVSRLNSTAAAFASGDTSEDDPLAMLIPNTLAQCHSLSYPPSLMVCTSPTTLSDPHQHLPDVSIPNIGVVGSPDSLANQISNDESRSIHSRALSIATTASCEPRSLLSSDAISTQFQDQLLTTSTVSPCMSTAVALKTTGMNDAAVIATHTTAALCNSFVTFCTVPQPPVVSTRCSGSNFCDLTGEAKSCCTRIPNVEQNTYSAISASCDLHDSVEGPTFESTSVSSTSPQTPNNQSFDVTKHNGNLHTESRHLTASCNGDIDCVWSQSPTKHEMLRSRDHHLSKVASDDFDVCSPNATAENLKDLEQVISSHSASLPAADDCDDELYLLKTSPFDLTASIKSDGSLLPGSKTVVSSHEPELLSSNFPMHTNSRSNSRVVPVSPDPVPLATHSTVDQISTEANITQPPLTLTPSLDQDSYPRSPTSTHASEPLLLGEEDTSVLNHGKLETDENDIDFILPVDTVNNNPGCSSSPHAFSSSHTTFKSTGNDTAYEASIIDKSNTQLEMDLLKMDSMSSPNLNGAPSDSHNSEPEIPDKTICSNQSLNVSDQGLIAKAEVYDEEEYVSAAVAAVDDVVFALAGNRKPDPSLEIDPTLEGTGTDRIFTLSLAPVQHHNESITPSLTSSNIPPCLSNTFGSNSIINNVNTDASLADTDQLNLLALPRCSSTFHGIATITGSLPSCTPYSQSRSINTTNTSCVQSDLEGTPTSNTTTHVTPIITGNLDWDQRDANGDYLCPVCPRVFSQKALLLKHRVMHDEPKHSCDMCGRCFVREDKLKRHVMSIHTAEKPHVCHICTKAFSRKDKLKDHLKHHDRAARNFECQQCQQLFVQKSDLNRHIRGVHQGEPGVGINMGTKRRAPGVTPVKPSKKKSKALSIVNEDAVLRPDSSLSNSTATTTTTVSRSITVGKTPNGKLTPCSGKNTNPSLTEVASSTSIASPTTCTVTGSIDVSLAAAAAAAASLSALPTANAISSGTHHPVFAAAAAASGFMLPTMALTQAHQQLVQQQHQQQQQQAAAAAAAAAAAMLPGAGTSGATQAHPSAVTLQQQQQQQFFALTNGAQSSTGAVSASNPQQVAQLAQSTAHTTVQVQPELKTVATPSGPMMVLTRIAAASNQTAGQAQQFAAGQTMFPQMVGFHTAGSQHQQHQQLQQLQQHAAVVQHQQLLQQQQASYAAAAAQQFQLQQHQQQATQLQQQHVAALAAHQQQQATHSFLFPSASATGATPAAFFCHPQDGMTAGLILASSADPTGFALAAQAAAAAAAQRQAPPTVPASALSASALAAATGLQVVTGYTDAATQQAVVAQQQQQLLQQQQQQRLAAVAAAAGAVSATTMTTPSGGVLMTTGNTPGAVVNGTSTVITTTTTTQDPSLNRSTQQQTAGSAMVATAQPDSVSASAAVNNCYQLAAALYQQHHPGLVFAAANSGANVNAGNSGSTVAAMALHHHQQQQQYQQQQQAGLMAAYHHQQQQAVAHQQALQQQHTQALQ